MPVPKKAGKTGSSGVWGGGEGEDPGGRTWLGCLRVIVHGDKKFGVIFSFQFGRILFACLQEDLEEPGQFGSKAGLQRRLQPFSSLMQLLLLLLLTELQYRHWPLMTILKVFFSERKTCVWWQLSVLQPSLSSAREEALAVSQAFISKYAQAPPPGSCLI